MPVFTLSNYRALTAGKLALFPTRPSASPNRFSSQALFLSLSMAEPGSRSCQVHWGSVGKREGRVSRGAVHVYYFRLLAVLPRRLWGKNLKRHTTSYVFFRVKQACQCLILKMSQEDFLLITNGQMLLSNCYVYIPLYVHYCMYAGFMVTYCMLSSSAALKLKAKCWKSCLYLCYRFKWAPPKMFLVLKK